MWWTNKEPAGHVMHDMPASYWAEGNFGQYIMVTPALDLVVVFRFDTDGASKMLKSADGKIKPSAAMESLWLIESASGAADIGVEPRVVSERRKEKEAAER